MKRIKTSRKRDPLRNPTKRVNVISLVSTQGADNVTLPPGILMRTTRSYAAKLVAAGTHSYTTKGKLSSFLNKSLKLYKNGKVIEKLDLKDKKQGHVIFNDPYNRKTYVGIKKGEKEIIMQHKTEVDPNTGKLKEFKRQQPLYEMRVARYPVS